MKNSNEFNYDEILQQVKDIDVQTYLQQKLEMSSELVKDQMESFKRNSDIYDEFKYAFFNLRNNNFEPSCLDFAVNEPVEEKGFTAYDLYQKFGNKLLPIGVFNLLISLREEPEETLDYIKRGLPER
ncbi:MAG: hypothetical protein ACI4L1_00365 [Christensenellales bacterium]